jgi:hypothetical protein
MIFVLKPKVNQSRDVKLDLRDTREHLTAQQRLLQRRNFVILKPRKSRQREIDSRKLLMLMSNGGRVERKTTYGR